MLNKDVFPKRRERGYVPPGFLTFSPTGRCNLRCANCYAADAALYYAKEHGRNQVRCHEVLIAAGLLTKRQASVDNVELF